VIKRSISDITPPPLMVDVLVDWSNFDKSSCDHIKKFTCAIRNCLLPWFKPLNQIIPMTGFADGYRCEVSECATHRLSPHGPCRPFSHTMEQAWAYTMDLPNRESTLPDTAPNETSALSTGWTHSTPSPAGYDHSPRLSKVL
jgi:hypothetical protein